MSTVSLQSNISDDSAGVLAAQVLNITDDEGAQLFAVDALKSVALDDVTLACSAAGLALQGDNLSARVRARLHTVRSYARSLTNDYDGALADIGAALAHAQLCVSAPCRDEETAWALLARVQPDVVSGRFHEAIAASSRARDLFLALRMNEAAARAAVNRGNAKSAAGDAAGSLEDFDTALPFLHEPAAIGMTHNNRGMSLVELDRFVEALSAYRMASHCFEQGGQEYMAAMALGNVADLLSRMGRVDDAVQSFERARDMYSRAGETADAARLTGEEGDAWLLVGANQRARELYQRAIPALDACGMKLEAARARLGLGLVQLRLGSRQLAREQLVLARRAALESGQTVLAAEATLAIADACAASQDPDTARTHALEAAEGLKESPMRWAVAIATRCRLARQDELDSMESLASSAEGRIADLPSGPAHWRLQHARAELMMRRGEGDRALTTVVKAMRLADTYRDHVRDETAKTSHLAHTGDLYARVCELAVVHGGESADEYIFDAVERLRNRSLHDALGGTGKAGRWIQEPIARVQRALSPGDAYVSFFPNGPRVCAQVITPHTVTRIDDGVSRGELASLHRKALLWISRPRKSEALDQVEAQANKCLLTLCARAALAPLDNALAESNQIFIAGYGDTHGLPLHLGTTASVSYVPGARLAMRHTPPPANALVVGVCDETAPRMEDEAQRVQELLQRRQNARTVTPLLGKSATADAVLGALPAAGLVHIACHCEFDSEFPMLSRIMLADRGVTARELAAAITPGTVVVLAGCETGRSAAVGEERMGIVRALLACGAGTVVSSLWPLHDQTAHSLFPLMYDALGSKECTARNISQSLSSAQRTLTSQNLPVAFHAGVVAIGGFT
jgi:tetratricopeptide (TPR) repeat protein